MARLNKDVKLKIMGKLSVDLHDKRCKKLDVMEDAIVNDLLDREVGDKNLKLMSQLPASYFTTSVSVSVMYKSKQGGSETYMSMERLRSLYQPRSLVTSVFSGDGNVRLVTARVFPAFMNHGNIHLDKSDPLLKRLFEVKELREKFSEDYKAAMRQAAALLESVTTDTKLLELWPECKKYFPKPEPVAKLPTVNVDELNSKISCTKKEDGCVK